MQQQRDADVLDPYIQDSKSGEKPRKQQVAFRKTLHEQKQCMKSSGVKVHLRRNVFKVDALPGAWLLARYVADPCLHPANADLIVTRSLNDFNLETTYRCKITFEFLKGARPYVVVLAILYGKRLVDPIYFRELQNRAASHVSSFTRPFVDGMFCEQFQKECPQTYGFLKVACSTAGSKWSELMKIDFDDWQAKVKMCCTFASELPGLHARLFGLKKIDARNFDLSLVYFFLGRLLQQTRCSCGNGWCCCKVM